MSTTTNNNNAPPPSVPALTPEVERLLKTIALPLLELPALLANDEETRAGLLEIMEVLANDICESVMLLLMEQAGVIPPKSERH